MSTNDLEKLGSEKFYIERYEKIFQNATVGIAITDLKGRFQQSNPTYCELLGYSQEELRNIDFASLVSAEDREANIVETEALVSRKISSFEIENRYIHKDGHEISVRKWVSVLPGQNGKPAHFLALVTDLTEYKKAQAEREHLLKLAKESELKYLTVFEQAPIAISLTRLPDWIVVEVNNAYLQTFGYSKEEIIGKSVFALKSIVNLPEEDMRIRLQKEGVYKDYECIRKTKSGETKFVLCNHILIRVNGCDHVLTTLLDTTRQKVAEKQIRQAQQEAERANSVKSQFLANMSHEIRTPLSVILGFSEIIKNTSCRQEEMQEFANLIFNNAVHLKNLLDDILDLSKIEADKMELEKVVINLDKFIVEEFSCQKSLAEKKGLKFSIIKEILPTRIVTDPTRLRQIIKNIVGNALKYTDQGEIEVKIGFTDPQAPQGRRKLRIVVKDTGIGMSPGQQTRMFQTFMQADSSTTRRYGGSGLGLVIAKKLALLLGGDVTLIDSRIDVGSTFEILIDPGLDNQALVSTQERVKTVQKRSFVGRRALLVEDNPEIGILVRAHLDKLGVDLDIATDGEQGLKKATEGNYDLIFMDIQLPKLDGRGVTAQLRQRGYKKPIIALTAHALKGEYDEHQRFGFTDCLTKPFTGEDLEQAIDSSLK